MGRTMLLRVYQEADVSPQCSLSWSAIAYAFDSNKMTLTSGCLSWLQAGDASSGADFARAKRHKKLSARLQSAAARSKMSMLKRQSTYVMGLLVLLHIGAFAATRVLLNQEKAYVHSVSNLVHCDMFRPAALS